MLIRNKALIKLAIARDRWRYPILLYVRNLHIESLRPDIMLLIG